MEQRLKDLRDEYERGCSRLAHLDAQREDVRSTLLRISGAIQVLEELLTAVPDGAIPPESATLRAVGT